MLAVARLPTNVWDISSSVVALSKGTASLLGVSWYAVLMEQVDDRKLVLTSFQIVPEVSNEQQQIPKHEKKR